MYRVSQPIPGAEGDLPAAWGIPGTAMLSEPRDRPPRHPRGFRGQAWQQRDGGDRWAVLDPQNVAARRSAAAAMLTVTTMSAPSFT